MLAKTYRVLCTTRLLLVPLLLAPLTGHTGNFDKTDTNNSSIYEARALIQADTELTLSSEIAGRITELPFREGDRFTKGQSLVRFDCRAYEGKLQIALATLKAARLKLKNQKRRAELDAAGTFEVALAEAEVERAQGAVNTARFPVERCHIQAPFTGRVVQLGAHQHETMSVGAPLIRILNDNRLEIKIVVPSHWLSWLKPGAPFEIRIDETGNLLQGRITRIGSVIDAVSQSLSAFSTLESPSDNLVSGMSGTARFLMPSSSKVEE